MSAKPKETVRNSKFKFEYATSTVSLLKGDGIVAQVVNDSDQGDHTRVVIYRNTGVGTVTAIDSGSVNVVPTWRWSLAFTIPDGGEYWVRIQVTSEFFLPAVSFERFQNQSVWVPVVSYRPGDFAAFKLEPTRQRIW